MFSDNAILSFLKAEILHCNEDLGRQTTLLPQIIGNQILTDTVPYHKADNSPTALRKPKKLVKCNLLSKIQHDIW